MKYETRILRNNNQDQLKPLLQQALEIIEKSCTDKNEWNHAEADLAYVISIAILAMYHPGMSKKVAGALKQFEDVLVDKDALEKLGNISSESTAVKQEMTQRVEAILSDEKLSEEEKEEKIKAIEKEVAAKYNITIQQTTLEMGNEKEMSRLEAVDKMLLVATNLASQSEHKSDKRTVQVLLILSIARKFGIMDVLVNDVKKSEHLYRMLAEELVKDKSDQEREKILNDANISKEVENLISDALKNKKDDDSSENNGQ